ncbi:MAG: protein kinase [Planctomycetes bacterium]|nr:protein kinase [Planctomycetota bacterium]
MPVHNLRCFHPCRSPEGDGATPSPDAKPDKQTAHVRAAYPVKAPEGRVTRRAEPVLPQRRMPGTDKPLSHGAVAPVPQSEQAPAKPPTQQVPVVASKPPTQQVPIAPPANPRPPAPAGTPPAPAMRATSAPGVASYKTPEELAAAREAAKESAKAAARAAAQKDVANRPTERMTREALEARKQSAPESGPLRPFAPRGVKASDAPTMPPHRPVAPKPVVKIDQTQKLAEETQRLPEDTQKLPDSTDVPDSGAYAPVAHSLPTARFASPEETEIKGNIEPVRDEPFPASAPVSPLDETQDMDPAEVEKPPAVESSESPRISFGQAALMLKLVSAAQIQECVNIQRMQMSKGQRVSLLGQILQERGYLDKTAIDKVKSYQQVFQFGNKIPGYQIVEKLGQGAMGAVFKARQLRMERWVAIKILQPELAANTSVKQRFLQEARASARLNHPNVIVGIDAGEIAGLSYFAMEYVEGKTLQQLVKERGPMDERQALEVIIQVAKALEHAEKHSLVHRDIKPDNIMVTRERVAKLLDLGLAKMRVEGDVGQAKGMAVGTPNYISPEQAMGRSDIDTRADIYSLGVTLFYVLTGRVPFEGPPEVVMYRHIHEPPPHPKNFRPDLGESVSTLIFTMMAKRPEDRPASAGQVVSDMEHLIRTGKLPGMFEGGGSAGPLRVNKTGGALVVKKRLPNLHGYGMPGQPKGPQQPQPGYDDPNAPVLPRKRRKRFGAGW